MSKYPVEELIDKMLMVSTLNATLIQFLINIHLSQEVDPDKVDSLRQGLARARSWMEEMSLNTSLKSSTVNILSLIVKRIAQIEQLLPDLVNITNIQPVPKPKTGPKPSGAIEGAATLPLIQGNAPQASIPQSDLLDLVPTTPPEPEKDEFKRVKEVDDRFGYVANIDRMIEDYSRRAHIIIPLFWGEAIKELHRYTARSEVLDKVIEIPTLAIMSIIKSLLSEAPGARLLIELKHKRPEEKYLSATEEERVRRAVSKYFESASVLLNDEKYNLNSIIAESRREFLSFDWGGPDLEKRILKMLQKKAESHLKKAEDKKLDDVERVIEGLTTKLICQIENAMLAEPRLRTLLAQMKP